MKKIPNLFFVSFMVCLLSLALYVPNVHAAQHLVITINNYSNNTVSLAFARENGYNTSDTTTTGWYNCDPGRSRTIKIFNYTKNDNYYWYGISRGKQFTNGRDFFGWIKMGTAFKSFNGRKLGGGMHVGFKVLNQKQGIARINIR